MKTSKILTFSLFAFTFALAAHATPSYVAQLLSGEYAKKDASPSDFNRQYYTAYYCTAAAAEEMFDGADSLKGIESYLKANFAEGKSAMGDTPGSYEMKEGDYGIDQYTFIAHYANAIAEGDYFAVAFYKDDAFRVFSGGELDSGSLYFDDSDSATAAGGWTTPEPTPEPTSALLMLIGVAGLALRRKIK